MKIILPVILFVLAMGMWGCETQTQPQPPGFGSYGPATGVQGFQAGGISGFGNPQIHPASPAGGFKPF